MRTLSRNAIIVLAIVLAGLITISVYSQLTTSSSTGPWKQSYPYPVKISGSTGVVGQSCADSAGYVYCVGGENANSPSGYNLTNSVYFAAASSLGVGNWTVSANPYPLPISFQSCATASGYLYCVGGTRDASGDDTASSYYAPLTPTGVGPWVSGTPYPVAIDALSCVASVGDLYCIGGENETSGNNSTTSLSSTVWYAPVSSSGIGTWSLAASYPPGVYFPSCTGLGTYIYCVGGENAQYDPENATYYSFVTSLGMGPWTPASSYPTDTIAQSCVASNSNLYCVGGLESGGGTTQAVYFATVSSSTLGPWRAAPSYPETIATDCVSSAGFIYCIGGYDSNTGATGDSYYAMLNATAGASTS